MTIEKILQEVFGSEVDRNNVPLINSFYEKQLVFLLPDREIIKNAARNYLYRNKFPTIPTSIIDQVVSHFEEQEGMKNFPNFINSIDPKKIDWFLKWFLEHIKTVKDNI